MADYKESMCLKDNVQYAPEFSIRLNNLVPDEDNFAHFMQIHADGGADYTALDDSVSGKVTLTYEAEASSRTVYCKIEAVPSV